MAQKIINLPFYTHPYHEEDFYFGNVVSGVLDLSCLSEVSHFTSCWHGMKLITFVCVLEVVVNIKHEGRS